LLKTVFADRSTQTQLMNAVQSQSCSSSWQAWPPTTNCTGFETRHHN